MQNVLSLSLVTAKKRKTFFFCFNKWEVWHVWKWLHWIVSLGKKFIKIPELLLILLSCDYVSSLWKFCHELKPKSVYVSNCSNVQEFEYSIWADTFCSCKYQFVLFTFPLFPQTKCSSTFKFFYCSLWDLLISVKTCKMVENAEKKMG